MATTDPQKDPLAEQKKRESFARRFVTETDKWNKMIAASYLVMAGDPNPIYFEYLENLARAALEEVGPYPFVLEPWKPGLPPAPSTTRTRELSPQYLQWRAIHKVDATVPDGQRYAEYVRDFVGYATLRDKRTRPLLVKALSSENIAFVGMAIGGLSMMGDLDDIDTIVQSIRFRSFPERQECYATLQVHTKSPAATARVEAALAAHDPAGLAFFREMRAYLAKLDQAHPANRQP